MRPLVLLLITVFVTGCSLSRAERAALTQQLRGMENDFKQQQQSMDQVIYNTRPPAAYVPPASSGQTRSFMINTPNGIVQKTCKKTNSNYVYCY